MTVASETNRSGPYSGNGVTTVFAYGFRIVDQSHLQVIRTDATGDEATLSLSTDYTVSGVGSAGGGSITLTTALPSGNTVTILRNIPFTQETDLENQGAYYAQTVEDALDLAVMRDQQLAEKLNRAVLIPATETDPTGALASQLAADITRLADSADNIDTVADSIAGVNTVADNVADLNTVADNIGAIVAAAGSVLDLVDASFTGDGSETSFILPVAAVSAQNVLVWVGGVRQVPGDDYSVSGAMLTLTAIPGAGVAIDVLVITAVTAQAILDLYGELQKAVNIGRCTVLTTAGQDTYAVSTDGDPLGLTPSNHILIGPAPLGALTYGVDYTVTEAGALVLAFSPREGDLLHLFLTPRTTNDEAQQILNEFQAMVAGDADRAEAAATEAALYDGPKVDTFGQLAAVTPAMLAVGGLIRVIETGAVYQRVSTGGDLDYSGTGGVRLTVIPIRGMVTPMMFGALPRFAGTTGRATSTDCSVQMQAAINYVAAQNSTAGRDRCELIIDDYYAAMGITLPTGAVVRQVCPPYQGGIICPNNAPAGDIVALANADVQYVTIKGLFINGNASSQTNTQRGFVMDLTGTSNTAMLRDFVVEDLCVHSVTGRGIHIGAYTRRSTFRGIRSYFAGEVGFYYAGSDCTLYDFDVAQSVGDGFVWRGSAGKISKGKVWAAGRYQSGSISRGYAWEAGNAIISDCESQENAGVGHDFFRSGQTIRGIVANNITSDADNVGGTGKAGINLFNVQDSDFSGFSGKLNASLAGTPVNGVTISGTSINNSIDVRVSGQSSTVPININSNSVKNDFRPSLGYLTPAMFGATGSGNDRAAIVAWLAALTASGATGWVDRDYSFASTIGHSGSVKIRGPFSDNARLIYTGTGDGLEFTGQVDIDGLVVDGNLASDAVPTSTSEAGCLLGIHGPMTGAPGYLSGVQIGRLRVQNTRRRAALAMVNLSNFSVDRIEASGTFGNAFHMVGLNNGRIGSYAFDRVGNLAAESSRLGAGISFYAEGDASKQPAIWYVVGGIQPTDNVQFGEGQGSRTTDTSIYLHDTYGSGVKNVRFGHYQGYLLGKDGVKFRGGAKNCSVSSCQLRKVGLRFAVIEDAGSDDNRILNIDGEQAGYDVLGEWLDGAPGTRNFTSAANGLNQTLNQTPGGVRMSGVQRSRMTGSVRAVRDAPHDGAEGNAVNFRSCVDCEMDIVADDADGLVRIGDLTRCVLVADATNMGRNLSNTTAAVYCDDAADQSSNNVLRVISRERSGSAVLAYACRINGTGSGWDADVKFVGPHLLTSGIVTRADSAAFTSYSGGRQVEYFRGAIAFDASALAVVTHNYGFAPSVQVITEGTLFYEVDVYANDTTTTTFRLRQSDDSTANSSSDLVPSVTRTVNYTLAKYRLAAGFPW